MKMNGVLIFLVCFGRSLVRAGTLLTVLGFLDGEGQVRASCSYQEAQRLELNPPVDGGVIQHCISDRFLQVAYSGQC